MSSDKIQHIVDSMDPLEAATHIATVVKGLLPLLSELARQGFIEDLVGGEGEDKHAGLVHF